MNFFFDQHTLEAIQDGRFSFAYGLNPLLVVLIAAALVGLVWLLYRKTTRNLTPGWKTLLITLRSVVLILLLICLLRPVITTEQVVPQESYLAVIVDDSQSMSIADLDGGTDVNSGGGREPLAPHRGPVRRREVHHEPRAALAQQHGVLARRRCRVQRNVAVRRAADEQTPVVDRGKNQPPRSFGVRHNQRDMFR